MQKKSDGLDTLNVAKKRRHLHLLEKLQKAKPLSAAEMNELAKFEDKNQTKKPAGIIEPEQLISTQSEAARYAGVSTRTIRRWVEGGMPVTADKLYIKAVLDTYKQNEGNKPSQAREKKQEAEARLKSTKAEIEEIKLTEIKGKFLLAEEVEKQNTEKVLALKRAFLGQGRRLAPTLAVINDPREIQEIIDRDNRSIISSFAEI